MIIHKEQNEKTTILLDENRVINRPNALKNELFKERLFSIFLENQCIMLYFREVE